MLTAIDRYPHFISALLQVGTRAPGQMTREGEEAGGEREIGGEEEGEEEEEEEEGEEWKKKGTMTLSDRLTFFI